MNHSEIRKFCPSDSDPWIRLFLRIRIQILETKILRIQRIRIQSTAYKKSEYTSEETKYTSLEPAKNQKLVSMDQNLTIYAACTLKIVHTLWVKYWGHSTQSPVKINIILTHLPIKSCQKSTFCRRSIFISIHSLLSPWDIYVCRQKQCSDKFRS